MSYYVGDKNTDYPYNSVVYVEATFPNNETYFGTGAIVGQNDVLTASHVIFSPKDEGIAETVNVYPARDGNEFPYGSYGVEYVDYFEVDLDEDGMLSREDSGYDYALLGFDESFDFTDDYFSLDSDLDSGNYNLTGYSRDGLSSGAIRMTNDFGYAEEDPYYQVINFQGLQAVPGNSGGPLWYLEGPEAYAVGTVSTEGWAVDITSRYDQIMSWMDDNDQLLSDSTSDGQNQTAENTPPEGDVDLAETVSGEKVVIDVLANDSDPDGDSLSVFSVKEPEHGTATIIDNGSMIEYQPEEGYIGSDWLIYTLDDGNGGQDTASVIVDVKEASTSSVGLYHHSSSTFYLQDSAGSHDPIKFGSSSNEYQSLSGDWDGSGGDEVGLYCEGSSTFYLSDGAGGYDSLKFGSAANAADYQVVAGNFNDSAPGDEVGLYYEGNSTFYLSDGAGSYTSIKFGSSANAEEYQAVVGDWNADAVDEVGLYYEGSSTFYLSDAAGGYDSLKFGSAASATDYQVVAGNFNDLAPGDEVGLYYEDNSTFYLSDGAGSYTKTKFGSSSNEYQVLSGDWISEEQSSLSRTATLQEASDLELMGVDFTPDSYSAWIGDLA